MDYNSVYGIAYDSVFSALATIMMFSLIIGLIAYVIGSFVMMKLFQKAGHSGWKAWVPFVNTWTLFEICYMPGWLVLLAFVPIVNFAFIVASFIMAYRLPQCFEKSKMWGVLCIFFSFIIEIICAFDYSEYCGYEK